MKRILLITTALVAMSSAAMAGDFDRIENNVRVETNGFGVGVKVNVNDPTREVGIDYTKSGVTVGYIRAEAAGDSSDENRPFVAYSHKSGPFYGRVQADYRDFTAAGSDEWARFALTIGAAKEVAGVTPFADITPKVAYGKTGTTNFTEIVETEWRAGFSYNINKNVSAGPFVQYVTDSDWKKQEVFLGTSVGVSF